MFEALFIEICLVVIYELLYRLRKWSVVLSTRGIGMATSSEDIMGEDIDWSVALAAASWEICMQVRKQQLELDMEQQTGSK